MMYNACSWVEGSPSLLPLGCLASFPRLAKQPLFCLLPLPTIRYTFQSTSPTHRPKPNYRQNLILRSLLKIP